MEHFTCSSPSLENPVTFLPAITGLPVLASKIPGSTEGPAYSSQTSSQPWSHATHSCECACHEQWSQHHHDGEALTSDEGGADTDAQWRVMFHYFSAKVQRRHETRKDECMPSGIQHNLVFTRKQMNACLMPFSLGGSHSCAADHNKSSLCICVSTHHGTLQLPRRHRRKCWMQSCADFWRPCSRIWMRGRQRRRRCRTAAFAHLCQFPMHTRSL